MTPGPVPKEEIRSLTGIRFCAALSILFNHLLLHVFPAGEYPAIRNAFAGSGVLGMNLFFILSGFIIHYNYSRVLREPSVRSFYRFFSARVARLYPLFFVVVAFEVFTDDNILLADAARKAGILYALPRFASMSQTWNYAILPQSSRSLAYAFDNSSITWSISTEFLMYAFYPVLLLLTMKETDVLRTRVLKAVLAAVGLSLGMRWLINHQDFVDRFGVGHYGSVAGLAVNPSHSFANWFLFLSPYMRIFEFIIGAFCAHLYLAQSKLVPAWEKMALSVLSGFALLAVAASYLPDPYRPRWAVGLVASAGYYPMLAVLVYSAARWPSGWLSRSLSLRPLVWAGEASYSLYLIHIVIYNKFSFHSESGLLAILRAAATLGLILLLSRILYELVEVPMRIRLRRWLDALIVAPRKAPGPISL